MDRRRPFTLLFVGAIVFAFTSVMTTQPSCGGIPDKTCFGDKVNALLDDGGTDPRTSSCTTCMQSTECCDVLGACGDSASCTAEFKNMQHCMLGRGEASEAECKQELKSVQSRALYQCIRGPCGSQCGIPNCDINPAVMLFASRQCDSCVTGACCEQVNRCYGNRSCKLFLECISTRCPKTLGASMTDLNAIPAAELDQFEASVCGDGAVPNIDTSKFGPGACLERCLYEYAVPDAGGGLPSAGVAEEILTSMCFAVGVYTCGARSNCGPACTSAATIPPGPYPEDDAGR